MATQGGGGGEPLASMGLERLKQEPWRLKAAHDGLSSELTALSLEHYRLHIENFECATVVKRESRAVKTGLTGFADSLGTFTSSLKEFQAVGSAIQEQHQRSRRTLRHHTQLLDLLEVPQVMETCVRNNVYDKALEVAKFATVLYRRHKLHRFRGAEAGAATPSGADAIIWGIVSDVRRTLVSMRLQLLRELCSKLSLPSCLQIVGNLRTLYHHQAVFDGTQHAGADTEASVTHRLKVELLRSRSEWHMQQLAALPAAAPYNYLLGAIRMQRTHWSDIMSQYMAVFSVKRVADGGVGDPLLHAWVLARVQYLTAMLRKLLPKLDDGGAIAAVLDLSGHCAKRLARFGVDFGSLLPPIFEAHMLQLVAGRLSAAAERFHQDVVGWGWAYRMSLHPSSSTQQTASQDLSPPEKFMAWPPLAALVNGFLDAHNHLRQCPITRITPQFAIMLDKWVSYLADVLLRARSVSHPSGGGVGDSLVSVADARQRFHALCQGFGELFLPYVCRVVGSVLHTNGDSFINVSKPLKRLEEATLYSPPAPAPAPAHASFAFTAAGHTSIKAPAPSSVPAPPSGSADGSTPAPSGEVGLPK